jgi:hypothetical protein
LPLPEYRRQRDIALPDDLGKPQTAAAVGHGDIMERELADFTRYIGWITAAGAALYLVRLVLAVVLKSRVGPDLAPSVRDVGRPDSMAQFLSLLGHRAKPLETLGTVRLRATLGIQLAYWGGVVLLLYFHFQMRAPIFSIESLVLMAVLLTALHTSLYEVSFDKETISLPRWWFGRTTHKWTDLLAVNTRDRWFLAFSFAKGPTVKVHKYIVGYARLMETAQIAMRDN